MFKEWCELSFKSDKRQHKLKSDEELLQYYSAELMKEHADWLQLLNCGCNDPFWADGANINLTRNHIIYYRRMIMTLCSMRNLEVPACVYEPVPPEVSNDYMADLNPTDEHQSNRLERIKYHGHELTNEKPHLKTEPQLEFPI